MPSESVKYGTFDLPIVAPEPPFGGSSAYNAGFGGEKLTIGLHTNDIPTASGGASFFDCTVGTGGDFATVLDAYTAGKRNALLISNVVETSETSVIQGMGITGSYPGKDFQGLNNGALQSTKRWTPFCVSLYPKASISIKNVTIYSSAPMFRGYAENCIFTIGKTNGFSGYAKNCSVSIAGTNVFLSFSKFNSCDVTINSTCSVEDCEFSGCYIRGAGVLSNGNIISGSTVTSLVYSGYVTANPSIVATSQVEILSTSRGACFSSCQFMSGVLPNYSSVSACFIHSVTGSVSNSTFSSCRFGVVNVTGTSCIFVGNITFGLTVGGTGNVVANNI